MTLLSKNDLSTIQTALDARQKITMDRTLGDVHIRVTTHNAPPVWYPYIMLARLECWRGCMYSTQYFGSVEQLRKGMRDDQQR